MKLYFLGSPSDRVVKVGISSNPANGLAELQKHSPFYLALLAVVELEEMLDSRSLPERARGLERRMRRDDVCGTSS